MSAYTLFAQDPDAPKQAAENPLGILGNPLLLMAMFVLFFLSSTNLPAYALCRTPRGEALENRGCTSPLRPQEHALDVPFVAAPLLREASQRRALTVVLCVGSYITRNLWQFYQEPYGNSLTVREV